MNHDIQEIEQRLQEDPADAVAFWEGTYRAQIAAVSEQIAENRNVSPVVLLAGPSASSKTTTASFLQRSLTAMGIRTHLISLDNYFLSHSDPEFPRLPDGSPDLESPQCLDIELLKEHFSILEHGGEISVPIYDFPNHCRSAEKHTALKAEPGDVFLFEGIHALNEAFSAEHPKAFRVYVSPEDGFARNGKVFCTPVQLRLMRRIVRDYLFRGAAAAYSLELWGNVVASEKRNVVPYLSTADCRISTTLPYELGVLKNYIPPLLRDLPETVPCRQEADAVQELLRDISVLPTALAPEDSILREFIGDRP